MVNLFGAIPTDLEMADAAGPAVLNEAATNTNPTLVPDKTLLGTGIGQTGTNNLSLIAGGQEICRVSSGQLRVIGSIIRGVAGRVTINNSTASATVPVYAFEGDTDTGLGAAAANQLSGVAGAVEVWRGTTTSFQVTGGMTNGEFCNVKANTEELTAMSGASVVTTNLIPDGALLLGLVTRVTTEITGASAFTIGDGTDVDRWGTGIALTAGITSGQADYTADTAVGQIVNTGGTADVTLTATTSNFTAQPILRASGGKIKPGRSIPS